MSSINHNAIIKSTINNVSKILNRILSNEECGIINKEVRNVFKTASNANKDTYQDFLEVIIETIRNYKPIEPNIIDIHEYIKNETHDKKTITNAQERTADSRTYLTLDRRYQSRVYDDNITFVWPISYAHNYDNKTTVRVTSPLKDIVGIRMKPFRFPGTEHAISSLRRLSVEIKEVNMQATISNENNRRSHFIFNVVPTDENDLSKPYNLEDTGYSRTEFLFYRPIQQLNSITICFGNPFDLLQLDADKLTATISADGVQSVLTFSQPHMLNLGDTVIIEDFTTDSPIDDIAVITIMNEKTGWEVAALTSTTVHINVDLTTLIGNITANTNIYLNSKRFLIELEFLYDRLNKANT